jgi:glycosyltransferase involved in cell wall biosynthesis
MVVANDVSTDTRVRKMAHDLATAGPRVTVIGVSGNGRREEATLGAATVLLIPVEQTLRIRRRLWGNNRHEISHRIRLRKARYFSYQREVGARIGWLKADYFTSRTRRNEAADSRDRERLALDDAAHKRRLARIAKGTSRDHLLAPPIRWLLTRQDLVVAALTRRLRTHRKRRQARREKRLETAFRRQESSIRRDLTRRHRRFEEKQEKLQARLLRAEPNDGVTWRRVLPELDDYEVAYGPVLDAIRPDVIHAQDVHLLGVAARAASRARAAGSNTRLVYDAHEYIQGLAPPRPVQAWSNLEAEYIRRADAVVTVAPAIAELLQHDYKLEVRPTVVMNIPAVISDTSRSLRRDLDLPDFETLLVYSGGLDASRGVHTLVKALERIPEVHLALVSKARTSYTLELEAIAERGGYRDRLHFASFVEPQQVVGYLSSADIGVHTIVSGPINHEVTLPNKLFEYMHARLPIVISDCKAMSTLVQELGIGRVFKSEDVDSLVEAIWGVIERRHEYQSVYKQRPEILELYSWRSERRKLFELYRRLLGQDAIPADLEGEHLPSLVHLAP